MSRTNTAENRIFPRISVVTPSYNHGKFLEQCICSVLNQRYPNLEYIIVDGGSSDNSVKIIEKYASLITYWVSEPDGGQYDAINKGFEHATGEILAWLNADDKYMPWAFHIVAEIFSSFKQVEWLTTLYPINLNKYGHAVKCHRKDGFTREGFYRGEYLPNAGWYAKGFIQQESTFWRRSLWERAGGYVDSSSHLAGDFELWARFYEYAELWGAETPLGGFRIHGNQKTAHSIDAYIEEAKQILKLHGGKPSGKLASFIHNNLNQHMPGRLRALATRFGLIDPRRICFHSGRKGTWKVVMR
jgi:hypothetical protein